VSGVRNPNAGLALYSVSKAAVLSLTRSAALEYAPRAIRINAWLASIVSSVRQF
jgi:NAD(P)-dependent dehydrogenase (short-subunit alcohol dehydrogenase family)